ncbi:hypothetical protein FB45DRAFT_922194 [Roridomyces roridus]|uniref:PIPK domain-containing protein n=1 Tax=Roridomyces roridus TaxID=1738132 RepID=A0AAD7FLG1_9AGAR|nr:hypothetical protein FB45DRAFT_922194 [Roridomyces roridus]
MQWQPPRLTTNTTPPHPMALSVDARRHRRAVLRYLLSEDISQDSRDEWLDALEGALDELGEAAGRGKWLAGIKRNRVRLGRDSPKGTLSRTDTDSSSSSATNESAASETTNRIATLRLVAAQSTPPSFPSGPNHLLLCAAPQGSRIAFPLPKEDSGFAIVPSQVGCLFAAGNFALSDDGDMDILYGLTEWDATSPWPPDVSLVGGTFTLLGATSSAQHAALRTALRVGVYIHLALLLEQQFLADSGVRLTFPLPRPKVHSRAPSERQASEKADDHTQTPPESGGGSKGRTRPFLPGILSFFGKKHQHPNPSLKHLHSNSIAFPTSTPTSSARSGNSLDLAREVLPSPRSRLSSDSGTRRFSFMGVTASPLSLTSPFSTQSYASSVASKEPEPEDTFAALHARIVSTAPLLSASPDLRVGPPVLIEELVARERSLGIGVGVGGGTAGKMVLRGDERVGLTSILGWDSHARDKEKGQQQPKRGQALLDGPTGFTRMQGISVLVSRLVPGSSDGLPGGAGASPASSELERPVSMSMTAAEALQVGCGRPEWVTWRFYARDGDQTLGGMMHALVEEAEEPCARTGCMFPRGRHVQRIVHGGVKVAVNVEEVQPEEEKGDDEDDTPVTKEKEGSTSSADSASDGTHIDMWVSCGVCGARTTRRPMTEGTFLFSWAKFLELLVYSPAVGALSEVLCSHTDPSITSSITPTPSRAIPTTNSAPAADSQQPDLPSSRLSLVRHFAPKGKKYTVRVTLAALDEVFELRVPRLQISRRGGAMLGVLASPSKGEVGASARNSIASTSTSASTATNPQKGVVGEGGDEKRALRREITAWWAGVSDHMDELETTLVGSTLVGFRKALPRLPSVDDAWDSADDTEEESGQTTPTRESAPPLPTPLADTKAKTSQWIAGLPPSAPTTPQIAKSAQEFFPSIARTFSDPVTSDLTPTSSSVAPTRATSAPVSEESLGLPAAPELPTDSLALLTRLRETFQRTEQDLYSQLGSSSPTALNDVRRAFLLAGRSAEKRLAAWQAKHLRGVPGRKKRGKQPPGMQLNAPEPEWWAKGCHAAPSGNVIIREDDWGSIIAFTLSSTDYYRELASMSLPRGANGPTSPALTPLPANPTSSFFSAPTNYKQLFSSSLQAGPDPDQDDVVWHEEEAYSAVISRKEHPRDATSLLSLREVLRQKSPMDTISASVLASSSGISRFGSLGSAATRGSMGSLAPPSAWAKPDVQISRTAAGGEVTAAESAESVGKILHGLESAGSREGEAGSRPASSASQHNVVAAGIFADTQIKRGKAASILSAESDGTVDGKDDGSVPAADEETTPKHTKDVTDGPAPSQSSFHSLTSGLSSAMRYVLSTGEVPRPSMFSKNHHGLLAPADAFAIDERPHVKYDWTIGKRLKFSCTVYYARQFDNLRKRCGIDDVFLKSLSRSANWAAEGGKSKSNFWKTADDRFIIKTLVNAWNVADLQVLIELAPSYFRYMETTASKATVLAKLIGFYTIEIRNLETGTVQSKADLLVMENLFYDQKIVKTFDLKGIQGRKVKSSAGDVKTLFDGEWIEGQQRTLTLVRPHSKLVLREAIRSDAEFLAKSNIMDYSLLLGVDQERKQIACGLVDTIGSYTFAKTLEYKAKQGLNQGNKEVTVMPPAEYQERFTSALEGYFLACPDKWSRPMDDSKPVEDPLLLPSVL